MPQWYKQEQETVTYIPPVTPTLPVTTIQPTPTVQAVTPVSTEHPINQSYDRETFNRAVEIAVSMQLDEQFGVSSQTVPIQTKKKQTRRRRLSKRAKGLLIGLPLAYMLVTFLCVILPSIVEFFGYSSWAIAAWIVTPILLLVLAGGFLGRIRQGALLGTLVTAGFIGGLLSGSVVMRNPITPDHFFDACLVFLIFMAIGAVVGAMGGAVGKYFRLRKRLPHWLEYTDESKSSE